MSTPRSTCANWPSPIDANAVAGNAEVDEIAIRKRRAGQHGRHPAVHGVEAVRIAEEIRRRLRRAADA
jgi:hypothetical protein